MGAFLGKTGILSGALGIVGCKKTTGRGESLLRERISPETRSKNHSGMQNRQNRYL